MKKISIRRATLIILVFTGLFLFNCGVLQKHKETYQDRISKCLKAAEATRIEFNIEGSDKKGYSIDVDPSCILGVSLPEFDITDMGKNRIRTKDLKGKLNIINFWFTQCAPCVAEIPDFNALVKKYKSKDINFLAACRNNSSQVDIFLKKHPFDFTIIPDGNDLIYKNFNSVWAYPFTIITNKENVIIGTFANSKAGSVINEIDSILVRQGL